MNKTKDISAYLVPSRSDETTNVYSFEFDIGDIVYLKTDSDQLERIVTGINVKPEGLITYNLSNGANESYHYAIEMSIEKDIIKVTTN